MKKLIYYGCIQNVGHNLFDSENHSVAGREHLLGLDKANTLILKCLDGTFTPKSMVQGKYNDCIVPPMRIVAWWDCSLDHRQNSNSALIGYGYESAEEMIDDAYKKFPSVMNRQPRPVKCEI